MDKEKLKIKPCQLEGLVKEELVCDTDHQKFLLDEKCFCENQEFGCPEEPLWKELEVRHDFYYSPLPPPYLTLISHLFLSLSPFLPLSLFFCNLLTVCCGSSSTKWFDIVSCFC